MSTSSDSSTNLLPQSGWTTEAPWCASLHLEPVTFRRLLKRYHVPHVPLGQNVLIDVSMFYQHISKFMTKDQDDGPAEKTKTKPKPKSR